MKNRVILLGFLALAIVLPAGGAAGSCPPPANYVHQASVQEGDVLVYLAAEKSLYALSEPISFYLAFENTGSGTVQLNSPYSPGYRIVMMPDSCSSMYDAACDTTWVHLPGVVFWFNPGITLGPGECHVVEDTWDGDSSLFPWNPGDYRVLGGMPGFLGNEFSVPTGGLELLLTIDSIADLEGITWGRLKDRYR